MPSGRPHGCGGSRAPSSRVRGPRRAAATQRPPRVGMGRELGSVAGSDLRPPPRVVAERATEAVARRHVREPAVEAENGPPDSPRPESLHEEAGPVARPRRLVDPPDADHPARVGPRQRAAPGPALAGSPPAAARSSWRHGRRRVMQKVGALVVPAPKARRRPPEPVEVWNFRRCDRGERPDRRSQRGAAARPRQAGRFPTCGRRWRCGYRPSRERDRVALSCRSPGPDGRSSRRGPRVLAPGSRAGGPTPEPGGATGTHRCAFPVDFGPTRLHTASEL